MLPGYVSSTPSSTPSDSSAPTLPCTELSVSCALFTAALALPTLHSGGEHEVFINGISEVNGGGEGGEFQEHVASDAASPGCSEASKRVGIQALRSRYMPDCDSARCILWRVRTSRLIAQSLLQSAVA